MAIIRWMPAFDPAEDTDKFFEDFGFSKLARRSFAPELDVYDTKDSVVVETPLPGIDPKEVKISIENGVLSIEGKSEKKTEVDEKNYYRKEIRSGSFYRSVTLPVPVKDDQAEASYEKGVLKITLPKAEEAKPKAIQVKIK